MLKKLEEIFLFYHFKYNIFGLLFVTKLRIEDLIRSIIIWFFFNTSKKSELSTNCDHYDLHCSIMPLTEILIEP